MLSTLELLDKLSDFEQDSGNIVLPYVMRNSIKTENAIVPTGKVCIFLPFLDLCIKINYYCLYFTITLNRPTIKSHLRDS